MGYIYDVLSLLRWRCSCANCDLLHRRNLLIHFTQSAIH